MRNSLGLAFCSIAVALVMTANDARGEVVPASSFSYGGWIGAAYTDENGNFTHCGISAAYKSGNELYFTVNADGTVSVAVSVPEPLFSTGENFPVKIEVDNRRPFFGHAYAIDANLATLRIDDFSRALESFKKGYTMAVHSDYGTSFFDLTGTFRALEKARNCMHQNISISRNESKPQNTDNKFRKELERRQNEKTIDDALMYQISTQMISEIGIKDFTYLKEEEIDYIFPNRDKSTQNVFLESDSLNLISGVFVIPKDYVSDLKETDSSDIAFLSSFCDGDTVTGSRGLDNVEFQVRQIRSACSSEDTLEEHFLNKTFLGDHILYTWMWFLSGTEELETSERQEISRNAAIEAVSYAIDYEQ